MTAAAKLMDKDPTLSGAVFFSTDNQTLVDDLESGRVHQQWMGEGRRNLTFYYTTYVGLCMRACVPAWRPRHRVALAYVCVHDVHCIDAPLLLKYV